MLRSSSALRTLIYIEEIVMVQGDATMMKDALSQARGSLESIIEANAVHESAVESHIVTTALMLRPAQLR